MSVAPSIPLEWTALTGLQSLECQWIGFSIKIFPQSIHKDLIAGCIGEQSHAGSEFEVIGVTKDLFYCATFDEIYQLGAFNKPGSQNWML